MLLLDPRVDPSADDNEAICNVNFEVTKLLIADPRVDPTVDDNYVIR